MTRFVDWCGFLGAWLLFAGPVYQAETELDAEVREGEEFLTAAKAIELPPSPSAWWWLLPPVGWVLQRRFNREVRRQVRRVLSPAQNAQLVRFSAKATGWMLVASGAGLIAVNETWTLTDHGYHWPKAAFWAAMVVMAMASFSFTASRARSRDAVLGTNPAAKRSRPGQDR